MSEDLPRELARLALATLRRLPRSPSALDLIITALEESGALDALAAAFRERIETIDGLTAKVVE